MNGLGSFPRMSGPCFGVLLQSFTCKNAQEMFMHNFGEGEANRSFAANRWKYRWKLDVSLHCEIVRYGTRKAETGRR